MARTGGGKRQKVTGEWGRKQECSFYKLGLTDEKKNQKGRSKRK
jgi:hypothetical protein